MTCIRMEPVWITLGLSAGLAAAQTVEEGRPVQAIDAARYRRALLAAGQVLETDPTHDTGWHSSADWQRAKPGYEWVFDSIDDDHDGRISPAEYRDFQAFKRQHADWQERLKGGRSDR